MRVQAVITSVTNVPVGTELTAQANSGQAVLTVEDITIIPESTASSSTQLRLEHDNPDLTEIVTVDSIDDTAGTITLTANLVNTFVVESEVQLYPAAGPRIAWVVEDGLGGAAIPAQVPASLRGRLPTGTRPDGEGEIVEIELVGETWKIVDLDSEEDLPFDDQLFTSTLAIYARSSDQNIPADTDRSVQWDARIRDDFPGWLRPVELPSGSDMIVDGVDGLEGDYEVHAMVRWGGGYASTNRRFLQVVYDDPQGFTNFVADSVVEIGQGGQTHSQTVRAIIPDVVKGGAFYIVARSNNVSTSLVGESDLQATRVEIKYLGKRAS